MSANTFVINPVKQNFGPKITFDFLRRTVTQDQEFTSDAFHERITKLTSRFNPTVRSAYESTWKHFYLPLAREEHVICTAVSIYLSYQNNWNVTFPDFTNSASAYVQKGEDGIPDEYALIFDEILRFLPSIKEHGVLLVEAMYPYTWRQGRIKRKYVCNPASLISKAEGDRLLAAYQQHLQKNLALTEISLNDYLKTAAICYRAAFSAEFEKIASRMQVSELTDKMLHKCWADSRHGGMLLLEDPDSKAEYMQWLFARKWEGAHPFEIVYSGNIHGIYLYPPEEEEHGYRIFVVDPFYNHDFLKMVAALIENNVPFKTSRLEKVIEYCRGESHIPVNVPFMQEEVFRYEDTVKARETYFSHIEWDEIKILEAI